MQVETSRNTLGQGKCLLMEGKKALGSAAEFQALAGWGPVEKYEGRLCWDEK